MRWRLLQIILRYRLIICLEERIIRVYLNLCRLIRKFENSSFLRNRCGNLCENGRCGGLSMPPIPFFLLPTSLGWLVASSFCPGDIRRRSYQLTIEPRGRTSHAAPNADGKQNRHRAIKLNANKRLDNLLSTRCMAPQLHEEKTGLPCALCESGRAKIIILADPGPNKINGSH